MGDRQKPRRKMTMSATETLDYFKEEMFSSLMEDRLQAVMHLRYVAACIGPERTLHELIPFLLEKLPERENFDNDHLVFQVAIEMRVLCGLDYVKEAPLPPTPELPGFQPVRSRSHYHVDQDTITEQQLNGIRGNWFNRGHYVLNKDLLAGETKVVLPILEICCEHGETVVRENACESIIQIVERFPHLATSPLFTLVHRLAKNENFLIRLSSIALCAVCYKHSPKSKKYSPSRKKLRHTFIQLAREPITIVRRQAADKFTVLLQIVDVPMIVQEFMEQLESFAKDQCDVVRSSCVLSLLSFSQRLQEQDIRTLVIDKLLLLARDVSWRVRTTLARHFVQFYRALGKDLFREHLLPQVDAYLRDFEMQIRLDTLISLNKLVGEWPLQFSNQLIPTFAKHVASHKEASVRSALAYVIGPIFRRNQETKGKELDALIQIVKTLQQDTVPEVVLNIVKDSSVYAVAQIGAKDSVSKSSLVAFIDDPSFRIRHALVCSIPELLLADVSRNMPLEKAWELGIEHLFFKGLTDLTHYVRTGIIQVARQLVENPVTQSFALGQLTRQVRQHMTQENYTGSCPRYQATVASFRVLTNIVFFSLDDQLSGQLVELFQQQTRHPIANCRSAALVQFRYFMENPKSKAQVQNLRSSLHEKIRALQKNLDPETARQAQKLVRDFYDTGKRKEKEKKDEREKERTSFNSNLCV